MADPATWSFDPATNATIRRLNWSQLLLVDSWALLGTALLLGSIPFSVGLGAGAGFLTVLVAISRLLFWVESDAAWLDGLDRDVAALRRRAWDGPVRAAVPPRLSARELGSERFGRMARDNRRLLAPAGVLLAGIGCYALGYALVGDAVVLLAGVWGIGGSILLSLVERGGARGEVDPAADRVTYRGRSRSLSSIADWWTFRLGSVTMLRCRGSTGVDEPTWLAVPAGRSDAVTAALADGQTHHDEGGTDRPGGRPTDRHRLGQRMGLVAVGVSLAAVGGGLAASQFRPGATSSLAAVAAAGAIFTVAVSAALLVGVLRERARHG